VDQASALQSLIEQTLRFAWFGGKVTPIGSHTTGWRTSPGCCLVHLLDMRTQIELVDHPTEVAEANCAIVLDAGSYHCLTSTAPGIGVCRWGHVAFQVLGGISVLSLFNIGHVLHPPQSVQLGDLCAELADIHDHPHVAPISQIVQRVGLGLRLLSAILAKATVNERGSSLLAHAVRLQPVLSWMDDHIADEASRESLARIAGLSPSRFHALFQLVMRQPPMAYLASRRVQRAQQLLLTTSLQIQDIAKAVGYPDPFHFSRVFKQLTGESPQRYRLRSRQWLRSPPAPGSAIS
jgi:AraC-like DNA-binding protein